MSGRHLDFMSKREIWFFFVPNLMLPLTPNLSRYISHYLVAQAPNLGLGLDSLFLTHSASGPLIKPVSFIFTMHPKLSSCCFCSYHTGLSCHYLSPKLLWWLLTCLYTCIIISLPHQAQAIFRTGHPLIFFKTFIGSHHFVLKFYNGFLSHEEKIQSIHWYLPDPR